MNEINKVTQESSWLHEASEAFLQRCRSSKQVIFGNAGIWQNKFTGNIKGERYKNMHARRINAYRRPAIQSLTANQIQAFSVHSCCISKWIADGNIPVPSHYSQSGLFANQLSQSASMRVGDCLLWQIQRMQNVMGQSSPIQRPSSEHASLEHSGSGAKTVLKSTPV